MLKIIKLSIVLAAICLSATPALTKGDVAVANTDTICCYVENNAASDNVSASISDKERARKEKQIQKAENAKENDESGLAITLIAMCIVLTALASLSILFYVFGKISETLQKSRKRKAHGVNSDNAEDHHDELDSGEVIAAISMALAEHTGHGHDIENTILTLRRMKKAYSPWNSKIYNMRHIGELPRTHHTLEKGK